MAIEKLPSVGTITAADSIPIASAQLGSDARVSMGTLLAWIQANIQSGTTPVAVTISGVPVLAGVAGSAYAGFTVTASGGTAPYTYSLNAAAIGAGLTIGASTGVVGGTTLGAAATYSASVTATDVLGSTAMLPFSLVISPAAILAPTITTQPNPQSVTAPATATFSVVATTGGGTLTYQWRKNGGNIAGATAASYTTPATTTADSGAVFTCVVSNSAGSVTSAAAGLTVAAAGPDTRPGWFAAISTASTTGTSGFVSGRTILSGSTNNGRTGTANPVTTTGSNFCWFAIANSGTPTFRDDASGFTGGFTLTGSPFTDANSTVWYLYKSDYAASYSSGSITLI